MAPRAYDGESAAAYNTKQGNSWSGSQTQDDGLYHPEQYLSGAQLQNIGDNRFYKGSQQGTPQASPSYTPTSDAYQQGQQYSPPHQTQRPDGGYYLANSKGTEQQQGSPNTFNNGAYQQEQSKDTPGQLSNTAAQGEPDSKAGYGNTLPSNTMLSTDTSSSGTASPTISATASSTTSPFSSPSSKHDQPASYQRATTVLSAGLGVVLVAVVIATWLHRRRRLQKQQPKQSKNIPDMFQNALVSTKDKASSTKGNTSSTNDNASSTESMLLSSRSTSPSADMVVSSTSDASSSTKKLRLSFENGKSSTKKRASSLFNSFVGAAVGTGAAALGAVRKLKTPKPQDDPEHVSNNFDKNDIEFSEPSPRTSSGEEKGDLNYSTPTLVDSPTEEQHPALRRAPYGQPQMKGLEQLDTKTKKASTILEYDEEYDEEQPETPAAHNTGDSAANSEGKTASNLTDSPTRSSGDSTFTSKSQSSQSIPDVSRSTGQFRVEIEHSTKKVGELNLREGQTVSIRQTFDDGWALCVFDESGHQGLAPRAYLSQQPIEPILKKLPTNNQSSTSLVSVPGSPRFYSKFGASRSFS